MKFCLYEILGAMEAYQANDGPIDSASLAQFLSSHFDIDVEDEGLFEATFVQFCVDYCG